MATHIRSGEITLERISNTSLTYRITVTIYRDTRSGVQIGEGGGGATFSFGDGISIGQAEFVSLLTSSRRTETTLPNETSEVKYVFEHTYQNFGIYTLRYSELARNDGILNINGGASDNFEFNISTQIRIQEGFFNSSPVLLSRPLDRACTNFRFLHNPGAFDIDGDSLAYRLDLPRGQGGDVVTNYFDLNDPIISTTKEDGSDGAIYDIDPITGTLTWDAPRFLGEYSIAFVVEEWRKAPETNEWILMGFVTRDMQIVAEVCTSDRPVIDAPELICVEAGTTVAETVRAELDGGGNLTFEAFGGPFVQRVSPSQFLNLPDTSNTDVLRPSPFEALIYWPTVLEHVRERPYDIQLKAKGTTLGVNAPSLFAYKTVQIKVNAPAPTGLRADLIRRKTIELNWDNYSGASLGPTMKIYRRISPFDYIPDACETGIPEGSGYELIEELPIGQTTFIDTENIAVGFQYCYRIVAEFPLPKGGESYVSQEVCVQIPIDIPLMAKVSIDETDTQNGETTVAWTRPFEINLILYPEPYTYELRRYNGFTKRGIGELITSTTDTLFIDTGINTQDSVFNYRVDFYDADNNLIDSTSNASSVRVEAENQVGSINITWRYDVPWQNESAEYPYHYIYRNRADANATNADIFSLIDSIKVSEQNLSYLDQGQYLGFGLQDNIDYCYYISTSGAYSNDIFRNQLLNSSQIGCGLSYDDIPPDTPFFVTRTEPESINLNGQDVDLIVADQCGDENIPCNQVLFTNNLRWDIQAIDIDYYEIYYSQSGFDSDFDLVGTSPTKTFAHSGLAEFKGCYKVKAFDKSGNESELSETLCIDNCPNYALPNAFTPNSDGKNDTFRAFDNDFGSCARFVRRVTFSVFDRWGGQTIYSYNNDNPENSNIYIGWNGVQSDGKPLGSGTYFFNATIRFNTFREDLQELEIKNWVRIIK